MEMIRQLMTTCDDLHASADVPIPVREKILVLRAGLSQVSEAMAGLQVENQTLRARRESLETQVMTLAEVPEPEPGWWDNVLYLSIDELDDLDSGDWEPDPAA